MQWRGTGRRGSAASNRCDPTSTGAQRAPGASRRGTATSSGAQRTSADKSSSFTTRSRCILACKRLGGARRHRRRTPGGLRRCGCKTEGNSVRCGSWTGGCNPSVDLSEASVPGVARGSSPKFGNTFPSFSSRASNPAGGCGTRRPTNSCSFRCDWDSCGDRRFGAGGCCFV